MSGIKILVLKESQKGGAVVATRIAMLDAEVEPITLARGTGWKNEVRKVVLGKLPGEILSVNVLAQSDEGAHVVVTMAADKKGFRVGRPVTRGGRPISKPKQQRTMSRIIHY